MRTENARCFAGLNNQASTKRFAAAFAAPGSANERSYCSKSRVFACEVDNYVVQYQERKSISWRMRDLIYCLYSGSFSVKESNLRPRDLRETLFASQRTPAHPTLNAKQLILLFFLTHRVPSTLQ
jgi:hypothetical protein